MSALDQRATRRLTRRRVAAAAAEVLLELGADAVTMQAVGDRLGVTAMALYRHVSDKAELFQCAADELLTDVLVGLSGPADEQILEICQRIRRIAVRHPGVVQIVTLVQPESPRLEIVRALWRLLRESRTVSNARLTYGLLVTIMTGSAAIELQQNQYGGRDAYRHRQRANLDSELAEILADAGEADDPAMFQRQVRLVLTIT